MFISPCAGLCLQAPGPECGADCRLTLPGPLPAPGPAGRGGARPGRGSTSGARGDFDVCRQLLQPFLNRTNETQSSLNGVYQPPIDYRNSQFYGFSEFYYCTEDVLRMGGDYNSTKYSRAAKVCCWGNAYALSLVLRLALQRAQTYRLTVCP